MALSGVLWLLVVALGFLCWGQLARKVVRAHRARRGADIVAALDGRLLDDESHEALHSCGDDGMSRDTGEHMCTTANYSRWAARIAVEFKLEYGIPKRTEANRIMVRDVLHKRLKQRNTRLAHMKAVLPLAIEMCFLKDRYDLSLEELMVQPAVVERAQRSVVPYWEQGSWISSIASWLLPARLLMVLERAFPGVFQFVPGFYA